MTFEVTSEKQEDISVLMGEVKPLVHKAGLGLVSEPRLERSSRRVDRLVRHGVRANLRGW